MVLLERREYTEHALSYAYGAEAYKAAKNIHLKAVNCLNFYERAVYGKVLTKPLTPLAVPSHSPASAARNSINSNNSKNSNKNSASSQAANLNGNNLGTRSRRGSSVSSSGHDVNRGGGTRSVHSSGSASASASRNSTGRYSGKSSSGSGVKPDFIGGAGRSQKSFRNISPLSNDDDHLSDDSYDNDSDSDSDSDGDNDFGVSVRGDRGDSGRGRGGDNNRGRGGDGIKKDRYRDNENRDSDAYNGDEDDRSVKLAFSWSPENERRAANKNRPYVSPLSYNH
jgi:hypothetical protein